ncbi:MAG: FAD-dependent oxidoreductase [Aeromicrobium sp.]
MAYVITQSCCSDAACVPVCPVDCIRPRPGDADFTTSEQLYIDPETCIDCGACMDECPVAAIRPDYDMANEAAEWIELNRDYFSTYPLEVALVPQLAPEAPAAAKVARVAIVGAGPAACYAADLLSASGVHVTLTDRLPAPFGLVRSGVAPDHQNTKRIAERFQGVLSRKNVTCYFNVEVGTDISLDELLSHHYAVIVAVGASRDRRLDIPGATLPGVHTAREFVSWYNGHPEYASSEFNLTATRAVVIGNGNVAIDVARILTIQQNQLETTDVADHALTALEQSTVHEVVVVGRRGPDQAAFGTGELLELAQSPHVDLLVEADELARADSPQGVGSELRERILRAAANKAITRDRPSISLRFDLTPESFDGDKHVESVTFRRPDGRQETIAAGLVFQSIGGNAATVATLPAPDSTGRIPNRHGRVLDPSTDQVLPGIYCVGWAKRGPSGSIGTNGLDAVETIAALFDDLRDQVRAEPSGSREDFAELVAARCPEHIDLGAWRRIDAAERAAGRATGRPRRKFVSIADAVAAGRR